MFTKKVRLIKSFAVSAFRWLGLIIGALSFILTLSTFVQANGSYWESHKIDWIKGDNKPAETLDSKTDGDWLRPWDERRDQVVIDAIPPYAPSSIITTLTWAPTSTIVHEADDSDTWPMTWADDDALYTTFGDGWGFEPKVPEKLSLGFAKIQGSATNFTGTNIRSGTGEQTGDGVTGKKASGMLMVDGILYMWVRNANSNGEQCQLAWSNDYAQTWNWSNWVFAEFGYCAFLNFGKNYAGARDEYVYMYSPNTSSAYDETHEAILTRVPKDQMTSRAAYEFFKGLDGSGNPVWTSNVIQRGPVFNFPGGVNRLDVTYNAPLGRYLMTLRSRARAGGLNQFSIYDAPEPWGPWTTVYYTESWEDGPLSTGNGGWGESQHIPSKWISIDGRIFYLVFAGDDSFAVRKATLDVSLDHPVNGFLPVIFKGVD